MSKMMKLYAYGVCVLSTLCLLQACQSNDAKQTFVDDALQQAKTEERQEAVAVPNAVTQALLNNHQSVSGSNQPKRFDIAVSDIPAKAFFIGLVGDSGANVVTHPEVEGKLTLNLKNVTVAEVLEVTRDIYGYEYKYKNGIYSIYPKKLRSEIFPINYIDVQRVGVSDTNVSIGQIRSSSSGSGGTSSSSAGSGSNEAANLLGMGESASNAGAGGGISPGSRVQTLNETDFWGALERTVKSIIGEAKEGRTVMVNPHAGMVLVTAMPDELNAVRGFLEKSEISVKRQVVLETKILEVELSEGYQTGIDWKSVRGQLQYARNVETYLSPVEIQDVVNNGEFFSTILKVVDINDLLSLLESQGSVQVLSSPRISTVNNQKAVIRVGKDEFFVTGLKNETTSSAATTTSSPEVEFASFFSGISLDVTPQISENNEVILHIHPIVSDVTDQIKEIDVGDSKLTLPLALREIRESDSIVKAKSGQMIVLGGLMQESLREGDARTPLLGRVPGLNAFFKQKSKQSVKTELVILLRPIVVEDDTWENSLKDFGDFSSLIRQEYEAR